MGAAGAGRLHKDYPYAFEALKGIREWDDPLNENYMLSLTSFCERDVRNKGFHIFRQQIEEAAALAAPKEMVNAMKTFWEEATEKGIIKGKIEGKIENELGNIAQLLSYKFGDDTNAVLRKIGAITDLSLLDSIYGLSIRAEDLERVERTVDQILADNPNATRPLEEVLKEREKDQ